MENDGLPERGLRFSHGSAGGHAARQAQLTRPITALRERGLLQGEADAADRRNTCLSLTDAGRAIQQKIKRQAEALNTQAMQGLSAEQQQALHNLLLQVKSNLDDCA